MTEENTGGLSAEETAYFESGGEAEVTVETQVETVQQEPTTETVETVVAETDPSQARDPATGKFAKTIPFDVFHAEREEHKRTKSVLEEIRTKQAVLEDRWNTLLKAGQPEQTTVAEDPEPDPNVDIFAHNAWLGRQLKKEQQTRTEREQQEQQFKQVQEQDAVVWNTWQAETARFAQEKPDFQDARDFLSTMRETQLKGLGVFNPQFATEQGRIQQINNELKEIIVAAKKQGLSSAQAIYELASAYGYKPKAAETPAQTGALPESLASVAAAQAASKTIGATSGNATGDPMSAESIAAMSSKEFEAWMKVPENASRFQRMMGG